MANTASMQGDQHRKGPWVEEEDKQLTAIVTLLGDRKWDTIARASGLNRSGKSCRLRWMNYLRPNLKHGNISSEEEQIILRLHRLWGNKWSKIARWLPGRTDNEIKNYWRTHLKKKSELLGKENCESNEVILIHNTDRSSGVSDEELATQKELEATDNYVDTISNSSEHAYVSSPYENNLYDWMPEVSTEYTEINQEAYGYTAEWSAYEDRDINIWDYSGSLWDMI